jgi:hypothetical protein
MKAKEYYSAVNCIVSEAEYFLAEGFTEYSVNTWIKSQMTRLDRKYLKSFPEVSIHTFFNHR